MMGSGKSTIGKALSKKLKMNFADVDDIIQKKFSISIAKIFKTKGQEKFREIEEEESIKLINKKGLVIALGGGGFINQKIRELIKRNSLSFWLDVDYKELFKRVKDKKNRPLVNNNTENDFGNLYNERKKIYSLADYKIKCNLKNKDEIVEEIKKIYENK